MTKILAIYNIKGGVGKTASSVNLSWLAAASNLNTLICDLDPQGAASFYFRVKPGRNVLERLLKGKDVDDLIKATDFEGLDLLPADKKHPYPDVVLGDRKRPRKRILEALEPLGKEYDLIILDCPPNLTLMSESIFTAADMILCPVVPTTLSKRTLEQLGAFLESKEMQHKLYPFFSMVESRKALHQQMVKEISTAYPNMLVPRIPFLSDVERMGLKREPVFCFKPRSPAALAYRRLWGDLRSELGV